MTTNSVDNTVAPRRGRILLLLAGLALIAVLAAAWFFSKYPLDQPVVYADDKDHFLFGSIGGDTDNGLPVRIMELLPELFADLLPEGAPQDWSAFGFIQLPGRSMPVGFSERSRFVPLAGMNCALCHTGVIRTAPDAEPELMLGMGSTTLDLAGFFSFLFEVADDPRFEPETLLAAMEERAPVSLIDRIVYKRVIERFKEGLQQRRQQLHTLFFAGHPPFGPGRVDTFNPYKLTQLREHYPEGLDPSEAIGTARYASIWNQAIKRDLPLNWDGNAPRIQDRNVGAAFGAGATPESLDLDAIARVQGWLEKLPSPRWPFEPPAAALVERGAEVYQHYCYECHDPDGERIGEVVAAEELGTDRWRVDSYTEKLNTLFLEMGDGQPWDLKQMRNTDGYVNRSLDGLWARAPYLHNGSVPTLWDLLQNEEQRNGGKQSFAVGHAVYDPENVGLRTDVTEVDGRPAAQFDLTLDGNSNRGHSGYEFGTELSEPDKRALIAYLTTL